MIDELVKKCIGAEKIYAIRVDELIREKYSLSNELAILRQKDIKPEEWQAYNAYCEECKRKAKEEIFN